MNPPVLGPVSWERMIRAVEKIRERLLRATAALEQASVPYAVIGGHAVAAWVSRIDETAVRTTRDVDLLLRRADFERGKAALTAAGFIYHDVLDVQAFVDGPQGSIREGIHVLFAGEKVQADYSVPTPDVNESETGPAYRYLNLDALVRMKLTSFRRKDQVHLLDLIGVGLVDGSWIGRVPEALRDRLQELLNDPNG